MPEVIWQKTAKTDCGRPCGAAVTKAGEAEQVSPCPEGMRIPAPTGSRQLTGPRGLLAWPLLQKPEVSLERGPQGHTSHRPHNVSLEPVRELPPHAPLPPHTPNSSSPSSRSSSSSGSRPISHRSSDASPRGFSSSSPPEEGALGKSPSSF